MFRTGYSDASTAIRRTRDMSAAAGRLQISHVISSMTMYIGHIELFVADPGRSKEFYLNILGCELVADQGAVVWMKLGDVLFLLRPGSGPEENGGVYNRASTGIVLYANDLHRTVQQLESRGLTFRGTDGPDCPTFTDPDGHWFQLVDPADHE